MSTSNMNSYTVTPLKTEDIKSVEGFKLYLIREGCKYIQSKGKTEKNIKAYFLFVFEHQPFLKNEKDKKDVCETIIEILDI